MAPKRNRDDFSPATVQLLKNRAGSRCSNPKCQRPTIGADLSTADGVTVVGVASHIHAAALGGPRYDPQQTPNERSSAQNGIWLCATCATLVDKNNGRNHPADLLVAWRREAEVRSSGHLVGYEFASWTQSYATIHYLNIPRLLLLLPALARSSVLEQVSTFRGLGYQVGRVVHEVTQGLIGLNAAALPLAQALPINDDLAGTILSVDQRFYTRNGPAPNDSTDVQVVRRFDEKKSPHLHYTSSGQRLVLPYDPAWVTTDTAFADFSGGAVHLAGLVQVKRVENDLSRVYASPIVLGIPQSPWGFDSWDLDRPEEDDVDLPF